MTSSSVDSSHRLTTLTVGPRTETAKHQFGNMRRGRLLLIVSLLVFDCSRRTQGHNDKKKDQDGHQHHGLGNFADENAEIPNPLRHNDFVKHKEHLIEHLAFPLRGQHATMTDEEMNFHFFQSHDEDSDGRLDGLELYQSVLHGLYEQLDSVTGLTPSEKQERTRTIMSRLVQTVDRILMEDDKDGDGYISYPEFGTARLASMTLKAYTSSKPVS